MLVSPIGYKVTLFLRKLEVDKEKQKAGRQREKKGTPRFCSVWIF